MPDQEYITITNPAKRTGSQMGTLIRDGMRFTTEIDELDLRADAQGNNIVQIDDMIFTLRDLNTREVAGRAWPDGRVPVFFEQSVSSNRRQLFRDAVRLWTSRCRVRFDEIDR